MLIEADDYFWQAALLKIEASDVLKQLFLFIVVNKDDSKIHKFSTEVLNVGISNFRKNMIFIVIFSYENNWTLFYFIRNATTLYMGLFEDHSF